MKHLDFAVNLQCINKIKWESVYCDICYVDWNSQRSNHQLPELQPPLNHELHGIGRWRSVTSANTSLLLYSPGVVLQEFLLKRPELEEFQAALVYLSLHLWRR